MRCKQKLREEEKMIRQKGNKNIYFQLFGCRLAVAKWRETTKSEKKKKNSFNIDIYFGIKYFFFSLPCGHV